MFVDLVESGWGEKRLLNTGLPAFCRLFEVHTRRQGLLKTESFWSSAMATNAKAADMEKWAKRWEPLIGPPAKSEKVGGDLGSFLGRFGGGI